MSTVRFFMYDQLYRHSTRINEAPLSPITCTWNVQILFESSGANQRLTSRTCNTFVVRAIGHRLDEREGEDLLFNVTPTVKKYSFVHRGSIPFLKVLGTKKQILRFEYEVSSIFRFETIDQWMKQKQLSKSWTMCQCLSVRRWKYLNCFLLLEQHGG